MGNFKDFDLDLRNVASGGEAEPNGLSKITTKITIGISKMSLKNADNRKVSDVLQEDECCG